MATTVKISIITSMYNSKKETIHTINNLFFPSLLRNASKDKEVIILDDCSPLKKETESLIGKYMPALKKAFGRVIFERNLKNYGFGKSFNKGISLAKGRVLLITNDDIYFPLNSINKLAKTVLEKKEYGFIGPITNDKMTFTYQYCKQAPKLSSYVGRELGKIESFASSIGKLMKGKRIETDIIAGFCFAIDANLIRRLGAFDENFEYGQFEDFDFARRANKKCTLIINPEVYIHHGGLKGASGSLLQRPLKTLYFFFINAHKYGKKWGHFETVKDLARGLYRMSGRDTVSEMIESKLKKK